MKHSLRLLMVCGFLVLNGVSLSFADGKLGKEALESLIKGNSVEGKKSTGSLPIKCTLTLQASSDASIPWITMKVVSGTSKVMVRYA